MSSGKGKHFFENLDALRFFSFFAVFLSHAFFTGNQSSSDQSFLQEISQLSHLGRLGVDFFFVLSSFLITWIILEELGSTQNFKLGYFYLRRILRIWPLYFLLVFGALALVAGQQVLGLTLSKMPPLVYLFTFTLNFYVSTYGPHFLFFLVFLWSISVEEQFYLVWAFFLKFFKKYLSAFCWLLIAISAWFRWTHFPASSPLYFHTLSVLSDFAMGAMFAKAAFYETGLFQRLRQAAPIYWIALYILLFLSLVFYSPLFHSKLMVSMERTWFALLFAFVIFEQSFARTPLIKFGRWPAVNYLGKRAYGLYCYHGLMLTFASKVFSAYPVSNELILKIVVPVVLFLFTTFAASVSYRYFEKPFLLMRKNYY